MTKKMVHVFRNVQVLGRRFQPAVRLVGILFWLHSGALLHAAPPAPFYRAVRSAPSDVFERGFRSWGGPNGNTNVLLHIEGTTCSTQNTAVNLDGPEGSAYVSLARTIDGARRVATARMHEQLRAGVADPRMWIYYVRPTQTLYNLAATFEQGGAETLQGRYLAAYRGVLAGTEWVNVGDVPGSTIIEAHQYRLETNTPTARAVEIPDTALTNPAYITADTRENANPLPLDTLTAHMPQQQRGRVTIVDAPTGGISACWCAPNRVQPRQTSNEVVERSDCEKEVTYFNEARPSVTYRDTKAWKVEVK